MIYAKGERPHINIKKFWDQRQKGTTAVIFVSSKSSLQQSSNLQRETTATQQCSSLIHTHTAIYLHRYETSDNDIKETMLLKKFRAWTTCNMGQNQRMGQDFFTTKTRPIKRKHELKPNIKTSPINKTQNAPGLTKLNSNNTIIFN